MKGPRNPHPFLRKSQSSNAPRQPWQLVRLRRATSVLLLELLQARSGAPATSLRGGARPLAPCGPAPRARARVAPPPPCFPLLSHPPPLAAGKRLHPNLTGNFSLMSYFFHLHPFFIDAGDGSRKSSTFPAEISKQQRAAQTKAAGAAAAGAQRAAAGAVASAAASARREATAAAAAASGGIGAGATRGAPPCSMGVGVQEDGAPRAMDADALRSAPPGAPRGPLAAVAWGAILAPAGTAEAACGGAPALGAPLGAVGASLGAFAPTALGDFAPAGGALGAMGASLGAFLPTALGHFASTGGAPGCASLGLARLRR